MSVDIFNFIKSTKWKDLKETSLYDMTSDILNCDMYDVDNYLKTKIKNGRRELNKEETLL